MESLYIESTKETPEILFDPENGFLKLKGQSYPENAFKFYEPILTLLDEYMKKDASLTLHFELPYINTSSSKCIMMLLEKLEEAYEEGKEITINWYYDEENEIELECAEEFSEDIEIPFNIIPLESSD